MFSASMQKLKERDENYRKKWRRWLVLDIDIDKDVEGEGWPERSDIHKTEECWYRGSLYLVACGINNLSYSVYSVE